jgi:hypothetical protein
MNTDKYFLSKIFFICCIIATSAILCTSSSYCQWIALPPYNTLWPLWSPTLSPLDIYGAPQPIVSSLTPSTILPVQPGLTWDPALTFPWLLYNTPSGLAYYDPLYGIDLWPPDYDVTSLWIAAPIGPPVLYTLTPLPISPNSLSLPPTSTATLEFLVTFGNSIYSSTYPSTPPLLTSTSIMGL